MDSKLTPHNNKYYWDIYSSCSPNCPSSISSSSGNCDFSTTSVNQCLCGTSSSSPYVSCNSNGDITILSLYFTFYTITHKNKPKTEQKNKKIKKIKNKKKEAQQV